MSSSAFSTKYIIAGVLYKCMFSASEVIDMAIKVEIEGNRFYAHVSRSSSDLRELFHFLAEQEEDHRKKFEKLKEQIKDSTHTQEWSNTVPFPGQIVQSTLFGEGAPLNRAKSARSVDEIIGIAREFEMTTVSFYGRILESARASAREVIGQIIEEEKKHVKILSDMPKNREGQS
jgi:rubrerythrin